mmetsp:Transcript_39089/g.67675  ORF Transcript_39089/g.67675 Transcript_39089/m.67675 type:complete len:212 (-) Transcript_39089:733-1368(-)
MQEIRDLFDVFGVFQNNILALEPLFSADGKLQLLARFVTGQRLQNNAVQGLPGSFQRRHDIDHVDGLDDLCQGLQCLFVLLIGRAGLDNLLEQLHEVVTGLIFLEILHHDGKLILRGHQINLARFVVLLLGTAFHRFVFVVSVILAIAATIYVFICGMQGAGAAQAEVQPGGRVGRQDKFGRLLEALLHAWQSVVDALIPLLAGIGAQTQG